MSFDVKIEILAVIFVLFTYVLWQEFKASVNISHIFEIRNNFIVQCEKSANLRLANR